MKFSTKILIGLAIICGLTAIYFGDDYYMGKKEEKQKQLAVALYFKPNEVLGLSLKNKNGSFVFERKDNDSPWKSSLQPKMNVDQQLVNNMIASLEAISVQQEIQNTTTASQTSLSSYGLEKPEITIELKFKDKTQEKLSVGNSVDIGQKTSGILNPLSVYALSSDRKNPLVVDSTFMTHFSNAESQDFYSKQIGSFNGKNVESISIFTTNKTITLIKEHDKWSVSSAAAHAADESFINSYIQMYEMLMAQKIYDPSEVKSLGDAKFNLKSQAANISFKDSKGKILQSFSLSLTKEGIFIPLDDGSIAQFPLDNWPDLVPEQIKFQNRKIMLGINMNDVVSIKLTDRYSIGPKDKKWADAQSFISLWKNLEAQDIFPSSTEEDLVQFGIKNPLKTFSFVFEKQSPIEITIGSRVPNNERSVYLKRSDSPAIYVVSADFLSQLAKLEINP